MAKTKLFWLLGFGEISSFAQISDRTREAVGVGVGSDEHMCDEKAGKKYSHSPLTFCLVSVLVFADMHTYIDIIEKEKRNIRERSQKKNIQNTRLKTYGLVHSDAKFNL